MSKSKNPRQKIKEEVMKELTFTPKINSNSKCIDKRINHGMSKNQRFDRLHKIAENNLDKLTKIRYEKENQPNEEELECMFHPELVTNYKPEFVTDMTFVERSNLWKQRRDNKVLKQQECKKSDETSGCTFQPKIL